MDGGGDVVAYLERHVSRVWCVHLKDIYADKLAEARQTKLNFHDAVRLGVFAPLGKGSIDFSRVLSLLKKGNFEGWLVVEAEQDPRQAHPLTYARLGHRNLCAMAVEAGFEVAPSPVSLRSPTSPASGRGV